MSRPSLHRTTTIVIAETDDVNNHYILGEQIGQPGQFGRAVLAKKRNPGPRDDAQYAIKIINKARFARSQNVKQEMYDSFRLEISIMRELDHPNVIKFYEVFEDDESIYIVMEFCSGGELFDRISKLGSYNEKDAAFVLRQVLEGIRYMHSKKIAHCDLKPDNFLFKSDDPKAPLKIIDFGMSKFVKRRQYFKKFCGTPYYVAPEVIQANYTQACDLWSIGVVLFVMLHGYPPFYADPKQYPGKKGDEIIYSKILRGFDPSIRKGYGSHFSEQIPISPNARDLITRLLNSDPKERLTAAEALDHPFFREDSAPFPISSSVLKALGEFHRTNAFKQCVLSIMTKNLSREEVLALENDFKNIDANHDGFISVTELYNVLRKVDKNISPEDVQRIMKQADVNGDGQLSIEELMMTYVQKKVNANEERMWDTFCRLDENKDGRITKEELMTALRKSDSRIFSPKELAEVQSIIAEVDKNNDGVIDYDEFLELWSNKQ